MGDKKIPRQKVKVTLALSDGRSISGIVQIDLDTRLSDFMNLSDAFIVLKDQDGALKIINKRHIVEVRVV